MSLITRCPACGTMFKVVTDQLKVSQGWVRCGHCAEVFDASLYLQTAVPSAVASTRVLDTPPAQIVEPTGSSMGAVGATFSSPTAKPDHPLQQQAWSPGASFADRPYSQSPTIAGSFPSGKDGDHEDFDPEVWKQQHVGALDESGSLRLNDRGEAIRVAPFLMPGVVAVTQKDAASADVDSISAEVVREERIGASDDVSFVREARQKAFWRKPLVRFTLSTLSLLLATLLVLQLVFQQKDSLAALEPRLAPLLQTGCEYLQCEIGLPRHIEAIVIDSSSFNKLNSDAYRLGFSLKNTSSTSVAMPSLEVTLTDSQDQPLLRRVLTPTQFGATSEMLGARADFAGLITLRALAPDAAGAAVPLRVAGYRVLAFYP